MDQFDTQDHGENDESRDIKTKEIWIVYIICGLQILVCGVAIVFSIWLVV